MAKLAGRIHTWLACIATHSWTASWMWFLKWSRESEFHFRGKMRMRGTCPLTSVRTALETLHAALAPASLSWLDTRASGWIGMSSLARCSDVVSPP